MNKAIIHEHGSYHPVVPDHPQPDDNWPYHNHPTTPHDREFGIKNPKFERHIFISREQILFDIDSQISMVTGARRKDDGTEDDRFSSATATYQQQFFRWIDTHIGKAKEKMQTFLLEKFKTTKVNSISQVEEVDIELLMPLWWDDTVFDQLVQAVHDYVVNATLFDYFSLTLTVKDEVTRTKKELSDENLSDIRKLSNASKPGSIRKRYKPF